MANDIFSRTELLLGPDALERLGRCKVAIFGIGGVGSYVAEALARSGIGAFVLIDSDVVAASNINRQILALHSTVGRPKVEVMRERILDINPQAKVETLQLFVLPENTTRILQPDWDYIVDAIDTVSAKIELVVQATVLGVPLISSMGAGNKLDPTRFEVTDLYQTSVCPLSKVMRRELRKRGVDHLKVVYSPEEPLSRAGSVSTPADPTADQRLEPILDETLPRAPYKRRIPGSVAFVPSVVGLIIAGEVVKDLIQVVR
ncbi:MAG: tRNA threonylcarbamoyladenosine dehydratase [Clostridia bacterium]|nr:tRNA threonylcarbamoyladenosine dehydratase [Clostridia bacterium]NCC75077.1 tRNA threonylcarbamoyladenosine dehydratase [Clostridia bacterium]